MMMYNPDNWWMMVGAAIFSAGIMSVRRRLGKAAGE